MIAAAIAALSMIMSPLLQSVLMPMMTRAHDRSEEEFFALLRRSIEGVLVIAIPVTMVLSVGADLHLVMNAINDALTPFSKRVTAQPFTPEAILHALGKT